MEGNPHRYGPWVKGLNTMRADHELGLDELRAAINVDITAAGTARQRKGYSLVYSGSNVHSVGPSLLFCEGGSLKRYDPAAGTASTLRTGLAPGRRVVYEDLNETIYWSNGTLTGRVTKSDFVNHAWGLPFPDAPIAIASSGGTLDAGSYQVMCSFQTADGEESGTGLAATVSVSASGSISVTSVPQPESGQGVTRVNVYVSQANGKTAYLHGYVAVGTAAYTILSTASTAREARNRFMTAPPAGNLISSRNGRIYIAKDNELHWTEPLGYGLYDPMRNYALLDSDIRVMGCVTEGTWIVTENITYFLAGDNPNEATLDPQADYSAPMQQVVHIPNTNDIAWLSHRGWVIGTTNGQLKNISDERVQTNLTAVYAPTMYREQDGIRQLVGLAAGSASRPVNSTDFNNAL